MGDASTLTSDSIILKLDTAPPAPSMIGRRHLGQHLVHVVSEGPDLEVVKPMAQREGGGLPPSMPKG